MKDTFMAPKAASAQKTRISYLLSVLGVYLLILLFFLLIHLHTTCRAGLAAEIKIWI